MRKTGRQKALKKMLERQASLKEIDRRKRVIVDHLVKLGMKRSQAQRMIRGLEEIEKQVAREFRGAWREFSRIKN